MTELSQKFEEWIRSQFAANQRKELTYHNLEHSEFIAAKVLEIANYLYLNETEKEDLILAGWLHDVGYWQGSAKGHEERSAEFAQACLPQFGLSEERILQIVGAIKATEMPQSPKNLFERILCDADLFHLGVEDFLDKCFDLKEEQERMGFGFCSELDWLKKTLEFMSKHSYHTTYGKIILDPVKRSNYSTIQNRIASMENENSNPNNQQVTKKKEKKGKPDRGIETLFRVTSANHMELSAMADTKANIMISVNSIIISIIVTVLIRKLEEFPNYTLPAVLLIGTCLIAMIFAILATRPKVSHGIINQDDIEAKKGNLLYFGNFHQMSIEEYTHGVQKLMGDSEYLYGSMIRDIYHLGIVLSKKYKLLRQSYNVFMFGFVISVLAFLIAGFFFESQSY